MAICKKCDRCHKTYDYYNEKYNKDEKNMNGISSICISETGNNYFNCEIYDLCPECLKSFKNWWDEINITLSDECIKDFEEESNGGERTNTVMDKPDELIVHEPDGTIKKDWGED